MLVALKTLDARYPALLDACVAGASRAFATFYLWAGNGHLLTRENQSIPESMYQAEIARELVEQRLVEAVTLEENLRHLGQANATDSESGRADLVGWRRVGAELKPFAAVEVKRGDLKLAEDIARIARLYASCSLELGVVARAAVRSSQRNACTRSNAWARIVRGDSPRTVTARRNRFASSIPTPASSKTAKRPSAGSKRETYVIAHRRSWLSSSPAASGRSGTQHAASGSAARALLQYSNQSSEGPSTGSATQTGRPSHRASRPHSCCTWDAQAVCGRVVEMSNRVRDRRTGRRTTRRSGVAIGPCPPDAHRASGPGALGNLDRPRFPHDGAGDDPVLRRHGRLVLRLTTGASAGRSTRTSDELLAGKTSCSSSGRESSPCG